MVTGFIITNVCMLTDYIYISCIILGINRKPGDLLAVQVHLQSDCVVYEQDTEEKPRRFTSSTESS
jgi:hypothetical protein